MAESQMGRPKIPIDWDDFDKLCAMHCTLEEIAGFFECTIDTIENRTKSEKGLTFSEYWKQRSAKGKISLRRTQYQKAMDGNIVMLIWLGKQYLNQKDKQEISGDQLSPVSLVYQPKSLRIENN